MHVLNGRLGGSGKDPNNLVMGPSSVNLGPEMKGVEKKLRNLLPPKGGGVAMWMTAKKTRHQAKTLTAANGKKIEVGQLTKQLDYSAGLHKQGSGSQWTKQGALITGVVTIPPPDVDKSFKPNLRNATPLLLKQAFVKGGLGTFSEADFPFKPPAVPLLRDAYANVGAVVTRIVKMRDIPLNQQISLKWAIAKMLKDKLIEL
jgi:hypothetical protein